MRKFILFLAISISSLTFYSCSNTSNQEVNDETEIVENFNWLIGEWQRSNESAGLETYETWTKNSDIEYNGIGWTIKANDTVFHENIRLYKADNKWIMAVKMPDSSVPEKFTLTEIDENSFLCENPEIDFPNKIKYWKNGDNINALISGNKMEVSFEFNRIEVGL